MTIRLYIDEDAMDQDLVRALRIRALDVVTALDSGMVERADKDHLEYASMTAGSYTVLTLATFTGSIRNIYLRVKHTRVLFWHRSNVILWAARCGVS